MGITDIKNMVKAQQQKIDYPLLIIINILMPAYRAGIFTYWYF